ncbi:MAG: 50S ribosomal protein L18 [Candidatus Staskawiczbacteria bacterium RIFCSPHIGHO2_02_FULL_42_22]|uniref:Large ribosomal subunit protein uL18 n=1 Tax=Candidatus Staskawiczbacteria bacterium RIFCSPHIGHO2_02_FULL_42_22 TaxID=1802207 RepID=A0A1G2HZE1_9BACT|nr:MAG: 50S ribosomal protein L18 [Candidatus Staskawiczbacteria bacterium RIFCSPHIGHO2_02_FULL_42_22]
MNRKQLKRQRIHKKIRATMSGTKLRPRLSVFRSSQHIYAQLIDDDAAKVLVQVNDIKMKSKGNKVTRSIEVGKLIAKEAAEKKIETVVFDRGGNIFHGRIKAVADGARAGGLKF